RPPAAPPTPAGGVSLPHALSLRAADAVSRGDSAPAQAGDGTRGRLPLGGGHPGGTAHAARARDGARRAGGRAIAVGRAPARLRVFPASVAPAPRPRG